MAAIAVCVAAAAFVVLAWLETPDNPDQGITSANVTLVGSESRHEPPTPERFALQDRPLEDPSLIGGAEAILVEGEQDPTGQIAGRVVDPLGNAVENATVELWLQASISGVVWPTRQLAATRSAADGRFAFREASCLARHLVLAHSEDRAAQSIADLTPLPGECVDAGDLVVVGPGRIEGSVHGANGAPAAGARVRVVTANESRLDDLGTALATVAGADGTYALEGVPAGTCAVIAEETGLATSLRDDVVIEPLVTAQCDFVLGAGSTISGSIIGSGGAVPADASVQALGVDPVTGATLGLVASVERGSGAFVFLGF